MLTQSTFTITSFHLSRCACAGLGYATRPHVRPYKVNHSGDSDKKRNRDNARRDRAAQKRLKKSQSQ
jgi:hypothetical protein